MAFDGIVIANLASELSNTLTGGRINKIAQPEKDELILTIKNNREQYRLFISAGASLPLIYLTAENKPSPLTAPNFCMLLRKHLNSAKILSVTQPGLERILRFEIEHLNELGDVCTKYLIVEIMGKHSNIIFCDENDQIIDSIKHISGLVSSVREVLPGRPYFIPNTQEKLNPLELTQEIFFKEVLTRPAQIYKALYQSLTGLSPLIANELCFRASIEPDRHATDLTEAEGLHLYGTLCRLTEDIKEKHFSPAIVFQRQEPVEFSSVSLTSYGIGSRPADGKEQSTGFWEQPYDTVSSLLESYYSSKNTITRIRQKSADLRRIVATAIERTSKKYDLQSKQLKDTQKRDKYKIYGELLHTYGYQAEPGAKSLTCENYYTNEEITIPLDETLTALENAQNYFDRYGKLKRTCEALTEQLKETKEEMQHLDSISSALDIALNERDLAQIKTELLDYGYIKKHGNEAKNSKKQKIVNKPFHYLSSDGYHIYVGKNNFQNEELTFKLASGNDWWFHAKGIAGSHVIVKSDGQTDLPDRLFEEAGALAAYYSKGREMDKVDVDYIQKKHIKKPGSQKPGFVIYHTNYSLTITPDIKNLTLLED